MKLFQTALAASLILCCSAMAQTSAAVDMSGNAQLNGTYHFRHTAYTVADAAGNLSQSQSLWGTIAFDGNGAYMLNGFLLDSNLPSVVAQPYSKPGTYAIGASGQGTISGVLSSDGMIYGLVANGIFIGSSTESNYNDLFIAAPAATTPATAASLDGTYWMTSLDFPTMSPGAAQSAWFMLTADGQGGIGTVSVKGHFASTASTVVTQSIDNISYAFDSGVATIAFPAATASDTLVTGDKVIYSSPDGNFLFGGSATGWDMFIGVRTTGAPTTPFSGLRFQAGLDQDVSALSAGTTTLAGYYGALNTSGDLTIGHQHLNSMPISTPYDFTYEDTYTLNSNGTYLDPVLGAVYVVGAGNLRIGWDIGTALGINVALPAAPLTGTGVFLNPQGIVNAASFAPFTAGIAPGGFVTLFGSDLAAAALGATTVPLPTTLGDVQVMINGVAAPVSYVSPGSVSVIVPYATTGPLAQVQVINNGVASNMVTSYVKTTSPGVFTAASNGLGYGAVLHLDYSLVTADNPAKAGETLAVFTAGLGHVDPAVAAGAAGPAPTLSMTTNSIGVIVDNVLATVSYAGLAPGFAGLYQVNFEVPTGVHSGDVYLQVAGPDALTSQAKLAIASGSGSVAPAGISLSRR